MQSTYILLAICFHSKGVTESEFEIKDYYGRIKGKFNIIDVGGQKSERKKWIQCFDCVTAVIFVASLSCYDEALYEDYKINSMTDQLELFDDVVNHHALQETSLILFLNKKDLFAEKVRRVPLNKCASFSSYDGAAHSFVSTLLVHLF